ncbi:MAG: hypothetical protein ACO2O6_04815 [Candidatus Hydrothermia bacterium]|jgi:hypothetical protein
MRFLSKLFGIEKSNNVIVKIVNMKGESEIREFININIKQDGVYEGSRKILDFSCILLIKYDGILTIYKKE